MFGSRSSILGDTPPVVKNLILLNVVMFVATWVLGNQFKIDLHSILGIHYYQSELFKPYQIVTHLFMHGDIFHIFFNMFALWMFGRILESVWGGKRFFIYYFITGIGAITINMIVQHFELAHLSTIVTNYTQNPNVETFNTFAEKYGLLPDTGLFSRFISQPSNAIQQFINDFRDNPTSQGHINDSVMFMKQYYISTFNSPTIGASGAVFGVLLAFGMLFPNTELMLLFPPIPIKAKWAVIVFGAMEFFAGVQQPGSNIAHFAHLGGMLFGFILIKYWKSQRTNFY